MDIDAIAVAMRKARPDLTPGTYMASQEQTMRGQLMGWRYTVLMMADAIQREHGPSFDRATFNKKCGV